MRFSFGRHVVAFCLKVSVLSQGEDVLVIGKCVFLCSSESLGVIFGLWECVHVSTLFQVKPKKITLLSFSFTKAAWQNCSQNHISTELKIAESSASNNKPASDKSEEILDKQNIHKSLFSLLKRKSCLLFCALNAHYKNPRKVECFSKLELIPAAFVHVDTISGGFQWSLTCACGYMEKYEKINLQRTEPAIVYN